MPTVAYIANQFPSPVEPYVLDEILALRKRGTRVLPISLRKIKGGLDSNLAAIAAETLYLQPLRLKTLASAGWQSLRESRMLEDIYKRALIEGRESPSRRFRALLHTVLGVYLALQLRNAAIDHIHAHHGYAASWTAMVAARLLGASYSLTLHGSDLLLHRPYLDIKFQQCKFCLTVSEFNRRHILANYPTVPPQKVLVQRLGVEAPSKQSKLTPSHRRLILLSVGRLHPVKDHAFLIHACRHLKDRGVSFLCVIAGDGPERRNLETLVRDLELQEEVSLLGHVPYQKLDACYAMCDLAVLTSRSEGIPLVLMEAMAHGRTVLAPAITGIPELVQDGKTGFLYRPGSIEDFVAHVEMISRSQSALAPMRREARRYVFAHFNRERNLAAFSETFLAQLTPSPVRHRHEDPLLQQI